MQIWCLKTWHAHSHSKVFDELGLFLPRRHDDGLVGDVGKGHLILTDTALGSFFTDNEHQQLCLDGEEERSRGREDR